MPPRQQARAALGLVGRAGYEWQDEKVSELDRVFGADRVHVNPNRTGNRPGPLDLFEMLPRLEPFQFVVEAGYAADTATFRNAVGLADLRDRHDNQLNISNLRADIVQTLPPRASGPLPFEDPPRDYNLAVLSDGDTAELPEDDERLRLRVIDIKLASEPGANYFAEVVYYSMTLAAWLEERELDDRYVVVAAPAVWPGSHDASHLANTSETWRRQGHEPTPSELAAALEEDLELAPVDAFAPRLRRLLSEQLPGILAAPWDELPWHVDYSCRGCEFLGYPWQDREGNLTNNDSHCWPTADRLRHLSRVAGLSRGGSLQLSERGGIADVPALALADAEHPAFRGHQGLRSKRTVYPHRARALGIGDASAIPDSGGDALMPRWPNLRLYVFIDYDLSSAVTVTFGLRAYWREPLPFGSELQSRRRRWNAQAGHQEIFVVDRRDLTRERDELLNFLRAVRQIMNNVRHEDERSQQEGRRNRDDGDLDERAAVSTYQIYLWDDAQRRHLTRLVSRHLPAILADRDLRDLAWLFPPPELLARAEEASRQSPLTIISTVVQNTVAAPVPHHYTLFELVHTYRPAGLSAPSIHPLYREPLSDLIPGERIHEYWFRRGNWRETQDTIAETTQKKLAALGLVTSQLERDLGRLLPASRLAAPPLNPPPRRPAGLSPHGRLWYEFTRLNAALDALDAHIAYAMPPHEREARFKSAILTQRLEGRERDAALDNLRAASGRALRQPEEFLVYTLAPDSVDVNVRDGDIGYALSPRNEPGFLDQHPFARLTRDTDIWGRGTSIAESGLTGVSIAAIDRIHGLIALGPGFFNRIGDLEQAGRLDLSQEAILDKVPQDFLTRKVRLTLQAIGHPDSAVADQRVLEALGEAARRNNNPSPETPASRVLWQARVLYEQQDERDEVALRRTMEGAGLRLNDTQWGAWEAALTRRLSLIWGPPGTGKSWTLRAVVLAAALDAFRHDRPLRVVITAGTYNAVDNVLLSVDRTLATLLPAGSYSLFRLQNTYRPVPGSLAEDHPDITNILFSKHNAPGNILDLQDELTYPARITILGAPAQQLHNLAVARAGRAREQAAETLRSWFDVVILDEASQLDVATATLVFSKAAENGRVILAGDDLQLPPIQKADAPEDLDHVVGSVYNYFRHHQQIDPEPLQISYRSNETLVAFTRFAGYDPGLQSYSPDLRLHLLTPLPDTRLADWPGDLFWTPAWNRLLDPNRPATCFIYEDELSSQVNDFEADAVAALIRLLFGRLASQLLDERRPDDPNRFYERSDVAYTPDPFWERAVGVVTPHKAQQSKIIHRLQAAFPTHPAGSIRDAVDTVERFQGQQRDVIIASFGLGDPDIIRGEDEFLYSLNRFNVLTSRARAKLIVFTSRSVIDHLSNDADVLNESRLLKRFAETFCINPEPLELGFLANGHLERRPGVLRWR